MRSLPCTCSISKLDQGAVYLYYLYLLLLTYYHYEVIGVFLNRLSDYLFVAARLDAHTGGGPEQRYAVEWRVDRWQRQLKVEGS